jgi:hypothetical protein
MKSLLCVLVFLPLSAFPQFDATSLRTKFGLPLSRETFTPRPGIEMVVDYASNGHVCRIQLPPTAPTRDPDVASAQAIDEFLAELLPPAIRGRELRRFLMAMGLPSVSLVEYENLSIAESLQGLTRTQMTVTFTREDCRK